MELTSLDGASTSVLRDDKTNQYFNTPQPTANSCQHHFEIQVLSQALKSSNVVDKMFTSYVISKPLRMNLFKMVTVTGITSIGDGKMTKGAQNINNKDYYFFDNGIQLRNALRRASNGYTYYYGLEQCHG